MIEKNNKKRNQNVDIKLSACDCADALYGVDFIWAFDFISPKHF
jgi:hypothetical protein